MGRPALQREITEAAYYSKFTGIGVGEVDLKATLALDVHDQIKKAERIENPGSQELRVGRDLNVIRRAHLVLAGHGILRAQLQERVNQLGLTSRVHFLGLGRDIPDVLGAADIFALSSDYEGNPLSVIEAMAAGLPIVSTAVGGVPELLQNGKQGFIVQAGHAEQLSEARRAMGAAAATRAREKFDVSAMVRAYEELYEEISAPSRNWGCFHFGHKSTATGADPGA